MLVEAHAPVQSLHYPISRPKGVRGDAVDALGEQLARAPLRAVGAKEHVFTEGDTRSHVYRVEAGALCLYKLMSDGRRQVLGFAYPGDLIGLGTGGAHQFNAQATKQVRLRVLPWAVVQQAARLDPDFGIKLYEMICDELAAARDLLLTTGQRTAGERVAAFLVAMVRRAERKGHSGTVVHLAMTRSDIADLLGLTIETVSRTFTKLRHVGMIDLAQSTRVEVLDMDGLEDLANGDGCL